MDDLIARARLQKAVIEATSDLHADPADLIEKLALAAPTLIAVQNGCHMLAYAQLRQWLDNGLDAVERTGEDVRLLHLSGHFRAIGSDRDVLARARRLLRLIGIRPGRRIASAVGDDEMARLATALAVVSAGCLVSDQTQAELLLCTRLSDLSGHSDAAVLMFGQMASPSDIRHELPVREQLVWFVEELDDRGDLFATAIGREGDAPVDDRQVDLVDYDIVDATGRALPPGQDGKLRIAGSVHDADIIAHRNPNGITNIVGRFGGSVRIAGRRNDLDTLRGKLRDVHGVRELVLAARQDTEARYCIVAYYSILLESSHVEVEKALQIAMNVAGLSDASAFELPRLPRDSSGCVDGVRLLGMPVLDRHELDHAGGVLRQRLSVDEVRLDIHYAAESTRPLPSVLPPATLPAIAQGTDALSNRPARLEGQALDIPDCIPRDLCGLLERSARDAGDVGILCIDTFRQTSFSYAGLLQQAREKAGFLREAGLVQGDRVLLHLHGNVHILHWFWGCVLAGAVPCMGTQQGALDEPAEIQRVSEYCSRLDARLIVSDNAAAVDETRVAGTPVHRVDQAAVGRYEPVQLDGEAVALILCTSGSTRRPKLVQQTHRALISQGYASGVGVGLERGDVSLNWMPLDHVGALVMFHLRDTQLRCRQIHVEKEFILAEPLRWLELITEYGVSVTWAPNFAFALLNARSELGTETKLDLSRLRFVISGGEAVMADVAERFLLLHARYGLSADALKPAWGMSETCSLTLVDRTTRAGDYRQGAVSVGWPVAGLQLRIVDANDAVLNAGDIGALQVRGPFVTQGYLGEDAAEAFTTDGWFRTGDLARLGDNGVTIVGRDKDVIIVNGRNVSCHMIEHALAEMPELQSAHTTAVGFRDAGATSDRVAVFVVMADACDAVSVGRSARARIRAVAQVEAVIVPVAADDIPRTQIGKAQRSLLQARLSEGVYSAMIGLANPEHGSDGRMLPPWFFRMGWERVAERPRPFVPQGTWLVCACDPDEARRAEHWLRLHEVRAHTIAWDQSQSAEENAVERASLAKDWNGLLLLPTSSPTPEQASPDQVLVELLHRLDWPADASLLVVTAAALGNDKMLSPAQAIGFGAVSGLLLSLRSERDRMRVRWVDSEAVELLERRLEVAFAELAGSGDDIVVRRRGTSRWVKHLRQESFVGQPEIKGLRRNGRYLVVGASGALGRQLCNWLRSEWSAEVIGLGRSEWNADVYPHASEEAGFHYVQADVCDALALSAALPDGLHLDGVFQLAGEFEQAMLGEFDANRYRARTSAKLTGTLNLLALLQHRGNADARPLLVLFGSVNGFFGATGAGAYAAACAGQAALAEKGVITGKVDVRYLGWSQWKDLGLSRRNTWAVLGERRGYLAMEAPMAMASLARSLSSAPSSLMIGLDPGHPHVLARSGGGLRDPDVLAQAIGAGDRNEITTITRTDRFGRHYDVTVEFVATTDNVDEAAQRRYESIVGSIWQDVIGVPLLDLSRNFFESGGSSIRLMQVKARLEQRIEFAIDVSVLFRYPTVRSLARYLAQCDTDSAHVMAEAKQNEAETRAQLRRQARSRVRTT